MRILSIILIAISISFCSNAQKEWTAVMSYGTAAQVYDYFYSFASVENFIKEKANKGQVISDLEYGGGRWYAVATQRSEDVYINWERNPSFPDEFIRRQWDLNKYITCVTWGDGSWVVVMTDKTPYVKQKWITRKTWDDLTTAIKAEWKKEPNYNITQLAYGDGLWAAVLSSTGKYEAQSYKASKEYPSSWIQSKYNEKYNITSVEHDGDQWYVVMTKLASQKSETILNPEAEFPKEKIREQWNKDRRISALVYTGRRYDDDDAFSAWAAMLDDDDDDEERLTQLKSDGSRYLSQKKYTDAIAKFKEAVNIEKNDHELWNNLAWSRYLAGYCYSALEDVNKSIALKSNSYNNHTKGSILKCIKNYNEALTYFNEAVRLRRAEFGKVDDKIYYVDRAETKIILGNYSGALDDFELALTIAPNDYDVKKRRDEVSRILKNSN